MTIYQVPDPKFIAHVLLEPKDGTPRYTLETEFAAPNWLKAYDRVKTFEERFGAKIISHRLALVGEMGPQRPLMLPAPHAVAARPALTVNAEVKEVPPWLGKEVVEVPVLLPYPETGGFA